MVRGQMEAALLDAIVWKPNFYPMQHFVEQLVAFASHFATTKWGGKHGFFPLVLGEAKMQPAAKSINIDCKRIKKPDLLNPRIKDSTQGLERLQFQADQKVEWQEYILQEVVKSLAVEAIIAAIEA